jgi:uncharacterized protein YcfL
MRKCFLMGLPIFLAGFLMVSCSSSDSQKEADDRSSLKRKQWRADSLEARQLLNRIQPDTTIRVDSLETDSLRKDSLLR